MAGGNCASLTPVTVLEAIQQGARILEAKGVDSPRLQSELILAQALGLPRLQLYLQTRRLLTESEAALFQGMIQRRGRREPLQHVLGRADFCGLELKVTPDVLIPRPETELLAEQAVAFLRDRAAGGLAAPSVLDLGTGSGCLSVYLAHEIPAAGLSAVDLSPAALTIARENARRHGVEDRIHFLEGDLFGPLCGGGFDLILSNPPYIPRAEIAALDPEVRDHDPRPALDGGVDGLDFYRRIAAGAASWLRPGGRLMLELGHGQAEAVRQIAEIQMWVVEGNVPDYSRVPRILIARRG